MSLELTKPADVADLFVDTCRRLRDMGATRVEAFGLVACFSPMQPAPSGDPEPRSEPSSEPHIDLSPEARELQARASRIAGGARS